MASANFSQLSAISAISTEETECDFRLEQADLKFSEAVRLTRHLIHIESVTPNDGGCQDLLSARMEQMGFLTERMPFADVDNLWAVRGGEREGPLIVFAGHTDVVPTGPVEAWDFPPFEAIIEDGVLYGRGVADMKGGIACFLVACERFVRNNPEHKGSIGFLITSDEEGTARWGTREVISELERRGTVISMCLVGEPSSGTRIGDTIKVGRRGSLSGELIVYGTQGHVAYPHLADNPLHSSLGALQDLVDTVWDQGNSNFPPTAFQISNVHGGTGATNVIPGHKNIHFNFRYSPETNDDELKAKVKFILDSHDLNYEIKWSDTAYPYETTESNFVHAVKSSIRHVAGIETESSTSGGTSDGRFIAPTGAQVVELGLINDTIHKINERARVEELELLANIYEDILERVLC